ncbi:hypothetical protein ACI2KR_07355 [Pseudomonas luteola]
MTTIKNCLNDIISLVDMFDSGSRKERNKAIVKRYLGLDGLGGCSMEQAGEPYKLTRESVRQILKKYKAALFPHKNSIQSLKQALAAIEKMVPVSAKSAELKLSQLGYIPKDFMIEGIINTASFLEAKDEGNISIIKEKSFWAESPSRFVVNSISCELVKGIYSRALKETSHNGASSVIHISDTLNYSKEVRELLVRDIIETIPGLLWLDEDKNWFYFSNQGRNRLISRLNKIFSVYNAAQFVNVKEAIRRSINKHNDEISRRLPNQVLESIFVAEGLKVEDGIVFSKNKTAQDPTSDELDKQKILDFEGRILDVLRQHPNETIQEVELENIIVSNTHDKYFYSMALNYSPLIIRIRRGTYRATGEIKGAH